MHIFTGDFNFKGLTAQCLYKSFGVKGLMSAFCYISLNGFETAVYELLYEPLRLLMTYFMA
jgi:hypothetical protein